MQETKSLPDLEGKLKKRQKVYIGLLAALLGVVLIGVALYVGESRTSRLIEKVGELLFVLVSLHFTYEWLVKDFDREEFVESVGRKLEPQQATLNEVKTTLNSVFEQTKSILNLVSYSDAGTFVARWKTMAERFENFLLIGDVSVEYIKEIPNTGAKKKIISVYRTVNERNRRQILEAMNLFPADDIRKVEAHHIGRFDWGFTVIASNQQGSEVEALLNYNSNPDQEPTGYYVFGNTAVALLNSVKWRLADTGSAIHPDESDSAVPIESEDMLGFILTKRMEYKSLLNQTRQGIPLRGAEAICQQMSAILATTNQSVDVTHIAKGYNIELLNSPEFKDWLGENFKAVRRGVAIRRIFLVQKNEIDNPILRSCVDQLKEHQIEVRYCFLEDTEPALIQDFSIYDEKNLVYISPSSGGAWREERTEAKHSRNEARIRRYEEMFEELHRVSKSFL